MFGLSNGDSNQHYADIDFALYTYPPANQVIAWEYGHPVMVLTGYNVGDLLRVAVESGQVRYYVNDSPFYSSKRAPTFPLLLDSSIRTLGATLSAGRIQGTLGAAKVGEPNQPAAATALPCKASFGDVRPSDDFYAAVAALSCQGALDGYAGGTVRPTQPLTRGQLAKLLVLAVGWQLADLPQPSFKDVGASDPLLVYVETAAANGFMRGYADGTFRPAAAVRRGELAQAVVLANGMAQQTEGGPHFKDVPTSNTCYAYVETLYAAGLVKGYDDGAFRPQGTINRGQAARIVYGVLGR